jgi:DNA-binding transcriptional LysR family regulator
VIPTPGAERIYGKVRNALELTRDAVTEGRAFDAATSERHFFVTIPHPLGPMIALRMQERLMKVAPHTSIAASTRSRPIDLERALREGRTDAAIDWLSIAAPQFREALVFSDTVVAVARRGHPALRKRASQALVQGGTFVSLRPRVDGEHPLEGIREWQRLKLHVALEVSEILEIFMVTSHSDLFGLIPRSMEAMARETFDLRVLQWSPKTRPVPIQIIWHAARDQDPAHVFLRTQLMLVTKDLVTSG